jgi:hypothetical protein
MKFWFAFPLILLLLSPMWFDRFYVGDMEPGSAGVAEGGAGLPPTWAEGGAGLPPHRAEGGAGLPPR